jgi:hypothetical protein
MSERKSSLRNTVVAASSSLSAMLFVSLCLSAEVVHPSPALADTAYKWEDSAGRTMFGSNPPPNARNVRKVIGDSFSRYSSDRLIKGNSGKKVDKAAKIDKKDIALAKPRPEMPRPAELIQEGVQLKKGPKNEVTACSVVIENTGQEIARGIQVSFEFPDGTLLQADGPAELQGGERGTFSAPHLPITLASKKDPNSGDPFALNDPRADDKPRVLVQFAQND